MARQAFVEMEFNERKRDAIEKANEVIDQYLEQDLRLTLRQLYYQFVSRNDVDAMNAVIAREKTDKARLKALVSSISD